MSTPQSALVILVPEVEALVQPFRERYDPSAAAGMPAHVTSLYPFLPPTDIDAAVIAGVGSCAAAIQPFDFVFRNTRRFPGVLYLVPEPDEPFRRITQAIWQRYPQAPPYGGRFPDIVPHLSLADRLAESHLDRVAEEFAAAAQGKLPVRGQAREIALVDNRSGSWRVSTTIKLGRMPSGANPPRF
jgi:hypothetical protein